MIEDLLPRFGHVADTATMDGMLGLGHCAEKTFGRAT